MIILLANLDHCIPTSVVWLLMQFMQVIDCKNHLFTAYEPRSTLVYQILCTATDVSMHGLLASQSCYHSVTLTCLSTLLASQISSLLIRHPYIHVKIFYIYL